MTTYTNTSWDYPHLYGASKYTHGIRMGEDYVLRLYHGPLMRPASVSVTPDGVYCGECGAEVTRAWQHAQRETDPQPDVVTCGKGQPLTVNEEPVDVEKLRTNHAELVQEHAELWKAYRALQAARDEAWKYYLEEQEANGDLRANLEELGQLYCDVVQERDALQEGIDEYDESNALLSCTVSELQEELQHTTSEQATTDMHRLARRVEGAEYALRSLQLRVADMAQDIERHITSAHPEYIAQRLRSMLPPTIGDAWGLAGWWATDRMLGDVQVVDAAADDDGEVKVRYMDTGRLVQGYAHVGALTNWRTTR